LFPHPSPQHWYENLNQRGDKQYCPLDRVVDERIHPHRRDYFIDTGAPIAPNIMPGG
jgi:hypothetical protein